MVLIHWHETRSRPRQRNALFALNVAASHVLALLREWRRPSKERTQFAKLDDRMLKDIGLTRTDGEFLLSYALQSWIAKSDRTYGSKPFEYRGTNAVPRLLHLFRLHAHNVLQAAGCARGNQPCTS